MRVLMLSWEYPPHTVGGLATHVAELAPQLAAQGVEVHVLTPGMDGGAPTEVAGRGLTIHRVPGGDHTPHDIIAASEAGNGNLERAAHELASHVGSFDVVHGHDWLVGHCGVALKYAWGVPLIATVHSMELGRSQGHLASGYARAIDGTERWLTTEASRVITVSRYMSDQVRQFFNIPADKIHVIHNGVRVPAHAALMDGARADYRARYAEPGLPIIFYIGRMVAEKGIQVLIDAAPDLARDLGGARFVVAGKGSYEHELRQRAEERGIADSFVFCGYVSDQERDRLYEVADVAVFPSLYEPFGIVALEAMARGCPVVASDTGGLSEVIQSHETGILTRPGDAGSLTWGLLHTLQHRDWAIERAHNARRQVERDYNWRSIATQTIACYRTALTERPNGVWRIREVNP